MNRIAPAAILAACVAIGVPAARGQDIVEYFDPASKVANKVEQIRGTIESENPLGIRVRPRTGAVKEIAAADIRYIRYRAVVVPELDYRKPFGLEDRALGQTRDEPRKRLIGESLQAYRDLLPRAKESPAGLRYIEYRIANLLAIQAEDERDKLDAAIGALSAFGKNHTDGWEIVAALKRLARLQEEKGNLAGAGEAYNDLARVPGITVKMQHDSAVLGARLLIRAGRLDDAEKKLAALEGTLAASDPAKAAVPVFLAQINLARGNLQNVEAQLLAACGKTSDPAVLAACHNILGDYYRKQGRIEDAFWQYLRVDTQYNDDREETAKALFYLAELFDRAKNDRVRARYCLTRLQDKNQFGGTEYHRKAVAESARNGS